MMNSNSLPPSDLPEHVKKQKFEQLNEVKEQLASVEQKIQMVDNEISVVNKFYSAGKSKAVKDIRDLEKSKGNKRVRPQRNSKSSTQEQALPNKVNVRQAPVEFVPLKKYSVERLLKRLGNYYLVR